MTPLELHKKLYIFSILLLILFAGLCAWFAYLLYFDTVTPIKFNNVPFPVVVSPGETYVTLTIDLCRYTDVPSTIYLSLENEIVYSLPPVTRSGMKAGECGIENRRVSIPSELPAGTYKVTGKTEFKVNSFAMRIIAWESQSFNITRSNDK